MPDAPAPFGAEYFDRFYESKVTRVYGEREIARLSEHPVPPDETLESLLKIDAQLRSARGVEDDAKWIASAPAAK